MCGNYKRKGEEYNDKTNNIMNRIQQINGAKNTTATV